MRVLSRLCGTGAAAAVVAAWQRLTLWARLVVAVTLGFVGIFGAFSVLSLRAVDDSTRQILRSRLVMAQMAAREIDHTVAGTLDALERARASQLAAAAGGGAGDTWERALLHDMDARLSSVDVRVWLLHRGSPPLADPAGSAAPVVPAAVRRLAQAAGPGRTPSFSQPFRDGGHVVVAVGVGLAPTAGWAALVVELDLGAREFVEPLAAAREIGSTGHALLIGAQGITLASTEPDEVLHPGEHLDFYLRMLARSRSSVETVAYRPWGTPTTGDGQARHVMAWAPLRHAPWGVSIGGTRAETFAPASSLRRRLLIGGAGALVALWLLAVLSARLLVHPVRDLTLAARTMAAGDLEGPVAVTEGGEIGVLAESLETMRVRLRSSLETIQQWGESLEHTVERRTHELRVRNRQLAAVTAVATAANQALGLEGMLDACLEAILAGTEFDGAAIRIADPRTGTLGTAVARSVELGPRCADAVVSGGGCACARAAAGAVQLELDRAAGLGCVALPGVELLTVLPLSTGGRLLGVLLLVRRRCGSLDAEERSTLEAIAGQLAVAIDDVQLLAQIGRIEAQREIQRLRSELISMVSHELRTPLGFIKGYATTLLRDDATIDMPTRRQFLEIIDEETGKLERMIDDLLDASRLQAERLPLDLARVDLAQLVRAIGARERPALHGGPGLTVRVPEGEVPVLGDALRLEQVIGNLLDNAASYGGTAHPIALSVLAEEGRAFVSVRDHGEGVSVADQARIFEPFQRGVDRRGRGVGLGLAICRGIVEAHGGSIWLESSPGAGTTFIVSLPLLADAGDGAGAG